MKNTVDENNSRYPEVTNDGSFDRIRNDVIAEYNKVAENVLKEFNPGKGSRHTSISNSQYYD